MVCSLRSRMSSVARSRTSSIAAVSGRMPSRLSLSKSCFSCFLRSSAGMPSSERAISRYLESVVSWRHSSLLFLSPYWPSSLSSDWRVSVRHANRGVSYFFLCFFGSPIFMWVPPVWLGLLSF